MHMKNDGTLDVSAEQRETIRKLEQRILDLEAKLVQRDVYEAEQRLPPEHAVLIKHLATVERCINEGPVTYHYAEESDCSFCGEWQGHTRDCAWLALQLDRGVTSIDDIHAVALQEHERRERQRMPRESARPGATLEQLNNIFQEVYGTRSVEANMRAFERGAEIHREIQEVLERASPPVIPDRVLDAVAPPDDEDVP